jgi:nucleoside-diphosphate-sugar epimerase
MPNRKTDQILVTGGSGFIGGWCILAALEAGYAVRTTVRDLSKGDRLRRHLHAAAVFDDGRLTVVRADLQSDEGWADAVHGCRYVMHVASPTLRVIRGMLTGALPVCPPFGTGWVDVRDVADLHLRAMTDQAAPGERFLAISGHSLRIVEVARILRNRLGERASRVPTREMPLFVARAVGLVNPQLRSLRYQLGHDFDATSARAESMLGWRPRPVEDSIAETAESLLAHGIGA